MKTFVDGLTKKSIVLIRVAASRLIEFDVMELFVVWLHPLICHHLLDWSVTIELHVIHQQVLLLLPAKSVWVGESARAGGLLNLLLINGIHLASSRVEATHHRLLVKDLLRIIVIHS